MIFRAARVVPVVAVAMIVLADRPGAQELSYSLFERYLDSLRQQAGIPGLAVAIVHERDVWDRAFGQRDLEQSIVATPDTPYFVADLTKTLSAVLLGECVERGLDLDEPIRRWAPATDPPATLRHLLTHGASTAPTAFKYDSARFALLTHAIEGCGEEPYRQHLAKDVLTRFAMLDSVPGRDLTDPANDARETFDASLLERYTRAVARLALPYQVDRRGRASRIDLPAAGINASTGLIASVRDLAKFDDALNRGDLLRPETLAAAWTNISAGAAVAPVGLGWFVQFYNGQRVVWHFGSTPGYSSLLMKIPSRKLTLILLANSDGLSAPFPLAEGDVTTSVFALLFLRLFA